MPPAKKKNNTKKDITDGDELDAAFNGSMEKARCFSPKSKIEEKSAKKN